MSKEQLVEREPRFTREQFAVSVKAERLRIRPWAVNISDNGLLVYLTTGPTPQKGDTETIELEADEHQWSARVEVTRCEPDKDGSGQYVGLRFLVGGPHIRVGIEGIANNGHSNPHVNAMPPGSGAIKGTPLEKAPPPESKPDVVLSEEKARSMQRKETQLKAVLLTVAILVLVLPPIYFVIRYLFGIESARFTGPISWVIPLWFFQAFTVPVWLVRIARTRQLNALRLIVIIVMVTLVVNALLYLAVTR
jgi:hypothetical protein